MQRQSCPVICSPSLQHADGICYSAPGAVSLCCIKAHNVSVQLRGKGPPYKITIICAATAVSFTALYSLLLKGDQVWVKFRVAEKSAVDSISIMPWGQARADKSCSDGSGEGVVLIPCTSLTGGAVPSQPGPVVNNRASDTKDFLLSLPLPRPLARLIQTNVSP